MQNEKLEQLRTTLLNRNYQSYVGILLEYVYDNPDCIDSDGIVIDRELFQLHIYCICNNFNAICDDCIELQNRLNSIEANYNLEKILSINKKLKLLELDRNMYLNHLINITQNLNIFTINTF